MYGLTKAPNKTLKLYTTFDTTFYGNKKKQFLPSRMLVKKTMCLPDSTAYYNKIKQFHYWKNSLWNYFLLYSFETITWNLLISLPTHFQDSFLDMIYLYPILEATVVITQNVWQLNCSKRNFVAILTGGEQGRALHSPKNWSENSGILRCWLYLAQRRLLIPKL